MAHASLERQLLAAQTAKLELENKLRDRDIQVERLEGDRRWLADREQEEREEKERDRQEWEEQKVQHRFALIDPFIPFRCPLCMG